MTRPQEIVREYLRELDNHVLRLKNGETQEVLEVKEFAEILHIHPGHLSNTIQEQLGQSPCSLFEERLMKVSKELILETDLSIAEIARRLTYDPSNFSKFFKHFEGITPGQFRASAGKN